MINLTHYEVWFITGSQHLYGEETLQQVAEHSQQIAQALDASATVPLRVVYRPVLTTPEAIYQLCQEANAATDCIGLIAWMHTFSPAKMWIRGLSALSKPLVHLHTQFNRDIPWSGINMDFMNLNQSAHGGREFGFMMSRMRIERKVVVGYWEDTEVQERLAVWLRVAAAWHDAQGANIARIGDNMREVAVTEGDKVAAQMQLGYAVNGYGIGDVVAFVDQVNEADVERLTGEYEDQYELATALGREGAQRASLREAARIELGLTAFLEDGNFVGFTDTFENLHGLKQLPGIAVQRLMAAGYGFGAEGDWKTAALVRAAKVMASGLDGGNSFMEDYTYHFRPDNMSVLGSHMLEICPSIAQHKPSCQVHPLGIGGKEDPVRLVFDVAPGPALNASIIDMGNRFRLLVNEVEAITPEADLPQLPVARVLWKPLPDLKTAAAAWIHAGGAHHTVYSQNLTSEHWEDFATIAGIECVRIKRDTRLFEFRNELRHNEAYYHLMSGFR
ncbi:L-arabinose isomerase [Tunicatimonas pelagia]|uniref:L-arabinose isomerase n=1 Tax=Tunicatimonas pelagia TaxID=931531 RepID=UPI0026658E32|nr:L-arabinose isomerase [Tunicatimonas pelagia]WKN44869.1 L-arabinose isomerase [Tunicatimonas pelagia]